MNLNAEINQKPSKKSKNIFKRYYFEILSSFIFTFVFFLKGLSEHTGRDASFFSLSDNMELWIPQIINLYYQVHNWTFQGIDFLTANGSSEFFLRPNIIIYSPTILLGTILFKISNITAAKQFLFFLIFFHCFIANFYCQLLARKFFHFDRWAGLFFANLYIFATPIIFTIPFLPFYLIAMLFPIGLYVCLSSINIANLQQVFLASIIFFLLIFSGYLPLSACAIIITMLFTAFYYFYILPSKSLRENLLLLVKVYSPIILACVIALPCILAIYIFNYYSGGAGYSLNATAHNLAILPSDMQSFIYWFFPQQKTTEQIISWGLIPALIVFIYLFSKNSHRHTLFEIKLSTVAISIYLAFLLISFGGYLTLSDIFYRLVPVLGKMHIYERYLIFAQLFFSLVVTMAFVNIIKHRNYLVIKTMLALLIIIWIILSYAIYLKFLDLNYEYEVVNLLLGIIFLVCLILFNRNLIIFYATSFIFLGSLTIFLTGFYPANENLIWYNSSDSTKLVNFFKANSTQALTKYINLSENIHSYIPHNYPWVIQGDIKLSNYYGYDLPLASDNSYRKKFSSYGVIDWDWLRKTSCKFAIFDTNAYMKYHSVIDQYSDPRFQLTLSNNDKIIKFKDNFIVKPTGFSKLAYDNGYIQIYYNNILPHVLSFKANSSKNINIKVRTFDNKTRLIYSFWPNRNLRAKVNKKDYSLVQQDGMYYIDLPQGNFKISFYYHNPILTFGLWLMVLYYIIIFYIILMSFFRFIHSIIKQKANI